MEMTNSVSEAAAIAQSDEIRYVTERSRLCRYLFLVAAIWAIIGASLYLAYIFFKISELHMPSFVIQMIGYALLSIALAVQRAIYRCPSCDASLSNLRSRETDCRGCGTQVKASR